MVSRDAGAGGGTEKVGVVGVEGGGEFLVVVEDGEEGIHGLGQVDGGGHAEVAAGAGLDGVEERDCARGVEPEGEGRDGDAVRFGDGGERRSRLGEVGDDPGGEAVVRVEVERGWCGGRGHEYG